jgi:HK97 family phage portal protein
VAFVVSAGRLATVSRPVLPALPYTLRLSGTDYASYETIWRTQPHLRTVVGFLARNIAQLGLHVFRRVSDTDRQRLTDYRLARLLARPLPPDFKTTRYRLINTLIHDLGIYDNAFWVKIGSPEAGLVRIPPRMIRPAGDNWLAAEEYELLGGGQRILLPAGQVVHFFGYNPDDPRIGVPPIESLRRLLAEEHAATTYREQLWRNGARAAGYIRRPADAPEWGEGARIRFKEDWQAQYAGDGPQAGGTPVLEDGMEWLTAAVTPEQAQYLESRKLTREEVAAAYHVPPPMVGILDHATFSNITEQHKMLYQDCLGPWLTMIAEDIELQLLPDLDDSQGVYVEFNIAEKLKGSFDEQARSIQSLVGAPVLTRNEGRALLNRNALPGGDDLVTPLNVLVGGQASPTDTAPEPAPGIEQASAAPVLVKAHAGQAHVTKARQVLAAFFDRQARAIVSRASATAGGKAGVGVGEVFDTGRWDRELAAVLFPLAAQISTAAGRALLTALGLDAAGYDTDRTLAWLHEHATATAAAINQFTRAEVTHALTSQDPAKALRELFTGYRESRAAQIATTETTAMSGFWQL